MGAFEDEVNEVRKSIRGLADNQAALAQLTNLLVNNIQKEQQLMSQITDWAASEQIKLDTISATLDTIVKGVADLDALISSFQNSPGTLSASDQAALDAIQAASAQLVTKTQAIVVTPPVPVPSPSPSPAPPTP